MPIRNRSLADECTKLPGGLDEVFDGDAAGQQVTVAAVGIVAQVRECSGGRKPLAVKHIEAATMLVNGVLGKEVAERLDVAEETVSRWRQRPEFQRLMQALLAERLEAARMGLLSLAQDSVEELRCLIHGGNDMVRLKAIELLLGTLAKTATIVSGEGCDVRYERTVAPPIRRVA
jgi:transposase